MRFEKNPLKSSLGRAVFATVTPAVCYHSSPDCHLLVNNARTGGHMGPTIEYASAAEAFAAGHIRPCASCLSKMAVKIEGDTYMRLTVEQLDTLRIIKKLTAQPDVRLKLRDIATARKCHVSTCYVLVRILQKKKLVKKEYEPGHRKARSGTITPTPLAERVLQEMKDY
jgi:DNA-binding MarR family transcriptional regulator